MIAPKSKLALIKWIRSTLQDTAVEKKAACSMFALMHSQGPAQEEIGSWKLDGKTFSPEQWASMFWDIAETRSTDLPGLQTYQVLAFFGTDAPQTSHPFVMNGRLGWENGATEGPDARGQLTQGMRLTEAIVQRTFAQINTVFEASQRMLDSTINRLQHTETENRELVLVVKELIKADVELAHEKRLKEMEYERSSREREQWLKFAPALLNTITGKEVFPQASADSAILDGVFEQLSLDQLQKMMGMSAMFKPELAAMLTDRVNKQLQKKKEEEEKRAQGRKLMLVEGTKDPAADAAGD